MQIRGPIGPTSENKNVCVLTFLFFAGTCSKQPFNNISHYGTTTSQGRS